MSVTVVILELALSTDCAVVVEGTSEGIVATDEIVLLEDESDSVVELVLLDARLVDETVEVRAVDEVVVGPLDVDVSVVPFKEVQVDAAIDVAVLKLVVERNEILACCTLEQVKSQNVPIYD